MADAALNSQLTIQDDFPDVDYSTWRERVEKDLQGVPFEKKLLTHTYEGIDLQPVYTQADWPHTGDPSGFPAMSPLTRNGYLLGHATCGWDVRQEHAHPDLAISNQAMLDDLKRGATSLQLRFDLASRSGESHDQLVHPEWLGHDGLMIYNLDNLDRLLDGIYPEMTIFGIEAGASFLQIAALFNALFAKRELPLRQMRVHFNADPYAILARDGRLPMSLDALMSQMVELAQYTNANLPNCRSVRVGTAPYHHAGATAAQDLAFSMATAVDYLRKLTNAGMSVDDAADQLLFSYGLGCNVFLAISKLRAARKLWGKVLGACGGTVDCSEKTLSSRMVIHARTSKRVMTQRDPWVNLLRNTVTTFAASVGGAQIITTEPFDRVIREPDAFSRRIARNTQVILQEESHLARVIDPAGGSWFIESLTDELCEKAWVIFQNIEKEGGMGKAICSGFVHEQIDSAFEPRLKNLATRKDAITGVSEFPNLSEKPIENRKIRLEPLIAEAQKKLAQTPPQTQANSTLAAIPRLKLGEGAVMKELVDAASHGATVGMMRNALVIEDAPITIQAISPHPYAEPFEQLRDASDAYAVLTGSRPRVFLANLGPVAHFTARTSYSKNFFEVGGFEVIQNPQGHRGMDKEDIAGAAEDAANAFEASNANIAVICSSDAIYETTAGPVAKRLKIAGARTVILAGFPGDKKEAYMQAGVDRFIYMKCDVLQTLRELLTDEGVLQ